VLIGINMDEVALIARFNACLMTDAKMAIEGEYGSGLADPFPSWTLSPEESSA